MADKISRKLAVLLHADVVDSTLLVQQNETIAHERMQLVFRNLAEIISSYGGIAHEIRGDALVSEFERASDAVAAAVAFQQRNSQHNDSLNDGIIPSVRIGIALGEVVIADNTITGQGIVLAQRLEQLADPSGVCIQDAIYQTIPKRFPFEYQNLGAQDLKGFTEPVTAFSVALSPGESVPEPEKRDSGLQQHPVLKKLSKFVWGGVAAGLVLVVAGYFGWQQWDGAKQDRDFIAESQLPVPDIPSIAVLPFDNMSEDASQEYFVDGMTEDLITDLSKLKKLFVIARNSAFAYKGKSVDARQIARELGVRYVLEGSVRRASGQIRVNAQLIDGVSGGHLWAERYDGTLEDIFKVQDQITGEIVSALKVKLVGDEQENLTQHSTNNAQAHDAFLQGWVYFKLGDTENMARSIPYFEDAIEQDPSHALAQAALASVYWDAFVDDWGFEIQTPSFMAEELAEEYLAESMKSPTPLAHAVKSRVMLYVSDFDGAIAEVEKAIALDQNDATSHAALANVQVLNGELLKAIGSIETAMRLDPHFPPDYIVTLGAAQYGLGKYAEAVKNFERAVKRTPDDEFPRIYLAATLAQLDRLEESEEIIEDTNDLRASLGTGGALSLEPANTDGFSPFTGEIDFSKFGNAEQRSQVREGLSKLKIMTWQYLVDFTETLSSEVVSPNYSVKGATQIDIHQAKALYDRGVKFIDSGFKTDWENRHIAGAINLPMDFDINFPGYPRLKYKSLSQYVQKDEEFVLYWCTPTTQICVASWEAAKAVNWGYKKVYWLEGRGVRKWQEAGYPVESENES